MNRRRHFLLYLALPLLTKVLALVSLSAKFIFDEGWIVYLDLLVSGVLLTISVTMAIRYVLWRRWIEGGMVIGAVLLALLTPSIVEISIYIDPIYWKFRMKEDEYLMAVDRDTSPKSKFLYFLLNESPGFGGGIWYYVVYDETKEIGLPPSSRSSEWKGKHGRFSGKDPADPTARFTAVPLEGNFFLFIESI
jgi:hypothetical protein